MTGSGERADQSLPKNDNVRRAIGRDDDFSGHQRGGYSRPAAILTLFSLLCGRTTLNVLLVKSIDTRLNARIAFIPSRIAGRSARLSVLNGCASAKMMPRLLSDTPLISSSRTNM